MSFEGLLFLDRVFVFVVGFVLCMLSVFLMVWLSARLIIKEYFKKLEEMLNGKKTNGKGKKGSIKKKDAK